MQRSTTDKEKEYKPTLIQCPKCTASGFAIHDNKTHWKCLTCGHIQSHNGANGNKMRRRPYTTEEWGMVSKANYVHFKDPDIDPNQLINGIPNERESKFINLTQLIKDWLFKRWPF